MSCLVYAVTNSLEYKGKFCEIGFIIFEEAHKIKGIIDALFLIVQCIIIFLTWCYLQHTWNRICG